MIAAAVIPIRAENAEIVRTVQAAAAGGRRYARSVRAAAADVRRHVRSVRAAAADDRRCARSVQAADVRRHARNVRAVIPGDRSRDSLLEMHACVSNRRQRMSARQAVYFLPMDIALWGEKKKRHCQRGCQVVH